MASSATTRIQVGEVEGSRWETALRAPSPALAPYVCRLVGYDERSTMPATQRQFPEAAVVVIFEFGPPLSVTLGGEVGSPARHPGGFVATLGDAFAICEHEGSQRGVQVDLTPTGARRLLGLPLDELTGIVVGLRDLFPGACERLADRLDGEPDWSRRLDLAEAFLSSRILPSALDTRRVDWAISRIHDTGGNVGIGDLARELGASRKHLITLFRDQVGVPPKLHARLVRFSNVMSGARFDDTRPWADLALAYGFYDQAHLVREVRHFTGLKPTEARAHLPAGLADLFG